MGDGEIKVEKGLRDLIVQTFRVRDLHVVSTIYVVHYVKQFGRGRCAHTTMEGAYYIEVCRMAHDADPALYASTSA